MLTVFVSDAVVTAVILNTTFIRALTSLARANTAVDLLCFGEWRQWNKIISAFPIFLPIFAPYNPYIPGCVFEFEFIDNAKCMHGNYYGTSAAHGAPMKVAIAAEKDKAQN